MSSENTPPSKTPNALESQPLPTDVAESPQGSKEAKDSPNDSGPHVTRGSAGPGLFGIPAYQANRPGKRYDYEQKYEPDVEGEEIIDNARVWHVYLDEMEQHDNDMLKGFRDTIDTLLIFAGLFSAIVTAFLVESIQKLEPDQAEITNQLLVEVAGLLRAGGNSSQIISTSSAQYSPDTTDLWVNGLFLTSLSLSLSTALLAGLIKQWLQAYSSLPSGSPKGRAHTRQFRFTGLEEWKVRQIISLLPLVIHAALAIFLMGLATLFFVLRPSLSSIVIIISNLTFLLYFISLCLPVFWPRCPYRVPELYIPAQYLMMPFKYLLAKYNPEHHRYHVQSFIVAESQSIGWNTHSTAFLWLFEQSFNHSVQKISTIALGSWLGPRSMWEQSILKFIIDVESSRSTFIRMSEYAMTILSQQQSHFGSEAFGETDWIQTFKAVKEHAGDDLTLTKCLFDAALERDLPIVMDMFLPADIDINVCLAHTAGTGRWDASKFLLERGANPAIQYEKESALHQMIGHYQFTPQSLDVVILACEKCTDLNSPDGRGDTLLHLACHVGQSRRWLEEVDQDREMVEHWRDQEIIEVLLRYGANPNIPDHHGATPLHIVVEMNRDLAELLLRNGADPNIFNQRNETPFHLAFLAKEPKRELVELLLLHGADPNVQNLEHWTPFHTACGQGNTIRNIVELMLSNGAEPDKPDGQGSTPLHEAVRSLEPSEEIVELLLNNGAEVNNQDNRGRTPLHWACCNETKNRESIALLLSHGANPNIRNWRRQLPIDVIREDRDDKDELRRLLLLLGTQQY